MVDCSTGERVDVIWVNLQPMQLQQQHDDDGGGGAGQPREQGEGSNVSHPPFISIVSLRVTPDHAKVRRAPCGTFAECFGRTRRMYGAVFTVVFFGAAPSPSCVRTYVRMLARSCSLIYTICG